VARAKTFAIGPKDYVEVRGTGRNVLRKVLFKSGAIRSTDHTTFKKLRRYYRDPLLSRNTAFFDAITRSPRECLQLIETVRRLTVAVIGCGGLGSAVSFMLASLGIRRLFLIDGDRVERSNLNRQFLFTNASIGRNKAIELGRALTERFSHTGVDPIPSTFPSSTALAAVRGVEQVVCVGDEPPDLFLQLRAHLRSDQRAWSAGYLMGVSVTGGIPAGHPTDHWHVHPRYFAPSISFQNMEVASTLVRRMILGGPDQGLRVYDYRRP
jgi:hypothetical protein